MRASLAVRNDAPARRPMAFWQAGRFDDALHFEPLCVVKFLIVRLLTQDPVSASCRNRRVLGRQFLKDTAFGFDYEEIGDDRTKKT